MVSKLRHVYYLMDYYMVLPVRKRVYITHNSRNIMVLSNTQGCIIPLDIHWTIKVNMVKARRPKQVVSALESTSKVVSLEFLST